MEDKIIYQNANNKLHELHTVTLKWLRAQAKYHYEISEDWYLDHYESVYESVLESLSYLSMK